MNKHEQERFVKEANALIENLGGTISFRNEQVSWRLETKVGSLLLWVEVQDWRQIDGPGMVFTRFDNPMNAKKLVDCNPFSGKWNHYFFDGWTVKDALEHLDFELRKITC